MPNRDDAALPILFTPGPSNLRAEVRAALASRDWGSRNGDFVALTRRVRERLVALAGFEGAYDCVLVPGAGTYAVEAALTSLWPAQEPALVVANGVYGDRMATILARAGRPVRHLRSDWTRALSPEALATALDAAPEVRRVAFVHVETTLGVLNPVDALLAECFARGCRVLVDAMSAFGALPMPSRDVLPCVDAIVTSANKCLEGAPGLGIVLARREALAAAEGRAASLSLDLHAQWRSFERSGEWRFTPPTHVVAALDCALDALLAEGGPRARAGRYAALAAAAREGLSALGFGLPVPAPARAPMITTFDAGPVGEAALPAFLAALSEAGCVVYPGKLPGRASFRVGVIGAHAVADVEALLAAAAAALSPRRRP